MKEYILSGGPLDGQKFTLNIPFKVIENQNGLQGTYKTPHPPESYIMINRLDWFPNSK